MEDNADDDDDNVDAKTGIFEIINHPPQSSSAEWESNAHRIGKISVCSLDDMSGWWHRVAKLAIICINSGNLWQSLVIWQSLAISGNLRQYLWEAVK